MILRLLTWIKSFFSKNFKCATCQEKSIYEDSAVIKVRHGNGAILDMIICKSCADKLEASKRRV